MKKKSYILLILLMGLLVACEQKSSIDPESLTISQAELQFTGFNSTHSVKVDATREWRAVSSDWWITVSPDYYPSAGKHFVANMAVTVGDNEGKAPRKGSVSLYVGDVVMATLMVLQDTMSGVAPEEEYPITWANLQWKASDAILVGKQFEAGCCVFADGITNVLDSETGEDITCDIGYCTENTRPDGNDWKWMPIDFNADWGNNFYYQGKITDSLAVGTYYYTFRVRNGHGPYKYAGTDGLWDGEFNVSGQFEVKKTQEEEEGPDLSQYTVTWANIQWTYKTEFFVGDSLNAGSKVLIPGLTNTMSSATGEGVICEMGYGTTANPRNANWIWRKCPFSADWGQEFYFQGFTDGIATAGTYYYTFRYSLDRKKTYVYAGSDGLWDSATNPCKTFTVKIK